jgi:hypothetical protein
MEKKKRIANITVIFPMLLLIVGTIVTILPAAATTTTPLFVDLENYGHSTGFSVYVPPANGSSSNDWVIDSFSDGEGRIQTEQFSAVPAVSPEFEEAATICELKSSNPDRFTSVSPSTGKTYYCGAFGSLAGTTNSVSIRMYQTFGLNPLEYHLSLLDYNTFYNANKRVVNITDTTIPLVDSTTNQTIQEIPAKIANIILLRNQPDSLAMLEYRDTVLYTTDAEMTDGYTYVLTFKRGTIDDYDPEVAKESHAANEVIAKTIFDSFRIMTK